MTANLDKVHHITTIARVTANLNQEDDWLRDVTNEMEIEDSAHRGLWRRGRWHLGVQRLRYREPDRARPDVQRSLTWLKR
ncbi:hypothetical protein [Bradyrhizobium cytisi]|uniref:hypothetical protein n=1 Tax=Bradyrhizobium cytisi TaxID=515489 RepID=UPI001FE47DC7|nr:hypothetical protein [Bradyrhizobium cytisi]